MGHERQDSRDHNDSPFTLIADMPADMDFRCHGPSADAQGIWMPPPKYRNKEARNQERYLDADLYPVRDRRGLSMKN
jgi:hypothetical protein